MHDGAICADEKGIVRLGAIGLPDAVVHVVDQHENVDARLLNAGVGQLHPLIIVTGVVRDIGMGFHSIYDDESNPVTILAG